MVIATDDRDLALEEKRNNLKARGNSDFVVKGAEKRKRMRDWPRA